jgi:hypothetical protein
MINANYDGFNLEIIIEVWRVKEAVYKLIDRLMCYFGKGRFFIDCGCCAGEKGKMICVSPWHHGEPCTKEGCEELWEK